MNAEFNKYKNDVEQQKEELLQLLATIGLSNEYGVDIKMPDDDKPLTELFCAVQVVADNLKLIAKELDDKLQDSKDKLSLIKKQSQAITELSTPVMSIWEKILILPIIGTIDTDRAQQIMENLLDAIVENQAEVGIIDITGVPVVDTMVANHLLKTIMAAKMLGAEIILTGVNPHNAQTLVKLGVEFKQIITKGSLQSGLKAALKMTDYKITNE